MSFLETENHDLLSDEGTNTSSLEENQEAHKTESQENNTSSKQNKLKRDLSAGALVVYLLRNYIDREDDHLVYEALLRKKYEVEEFCRQLFLQLIIDEESGYAYVKSLSEEELPSDKLQRPPLLLTKRPLPFYSSFILVLLRQKLLEFDTTGQFGRLVLERGEIISLVKSFLHNVNNDKRLDDNLNKAIDDLCSLNLLYKLKSNTDKKNNALERIEVKRIISVIVTPDILSHADSLLESYVKHIQDGAQGRSRSLNSDDE